MWDQIELQPGRMQASVAVPVVRMNTKTLPKFLFKLSGRYVALDGLFNGPKASVHA